MRRPLHRAWLSWRARPVLRYLRDIEQSQWDSADAHAAMQARKLRRLLAHAARTAPFYRDLFRREGFDPRSVTAVTDLARIPVLERETLVERFDDLRSDAPPWPPVVRRTGGSTGTPVRFLVDAFEMQARSAHIYRNLRWFGWDISDRVAYLWGSDVDSRDHRGWAARLRDAVTGVLWLDAFGLEEAQLPAYLDRIEAFSPCLLIGYPSSLALLAEQAHRSGRRIPLVGVQTSAEMLTPGVREALARAFACRVLDRYGCREAGIVAHECPAGRYHVNAESVVLESVDGAAVITSLTNYAMPLIRYRNEDLATVSTGERCDCGRGLPLVERIRGRMADVIRSPAGKLIHGEFFTHLFYDAPGVRRFQVRQTSPADLEIACVADAAFTQQARARLEGHIRHHGDPAFRVHWLDVDEIPAGPSGKYRFTIALTERSSRS